LLILAGCDGLPRPGWLTGDVKVPTGVSIAALAANGQVTYAVSVQETSVSLQDLLRKLGLPVTSVKVDESTGVVRIKSFGPDQQEFAFVLYPENSGSKTRVALEWDKGGAGGKSLEILLLLEKSRRPSAAGG
jgi:hypothetical protein